MSLNWSLNQNAFALDLMAENQTLRNLLKSLSAFIGEGAGGLLPKLGWDLSDFNDFINKSETDTAWEGFHRRKKGQNPNTDGESSNAASSMTLSTKRPADGDPLGSRAKKSRNDEHDKDDQSGFSLLASMSGSTSIQPPPLYPPASRLERNGIFSDMLGGPNGSPMFMHSTGASASSQYNGAGGSNLDRYSSSYLPNVNINMDHRASSSYDSPSTSLSQHQDANDTNGTEDQDGEDDPKKNEAYKLIQWVYTNVHCPYYL